MNEQAPNDPVRRAGRGWPPSYKNPRRKNSGTKIPEYRYQFLEVLPSQVLRPLSAARDGRRTILARRAYFAEFERQLSIYIQDETIWSDSVEDSMDRRGQELVDRDDDAQCQAFLASIGLDTLEKRHKRETAIGAAQLERELLTIELGLADGD